MLIVQKLRANRLDQTHRIQLFTLIDDGCGELLDQRNGESVVDEEQRLKSQIEQVGRVRPRCRFEIPDDLRGVQFVGHSEPLGFVA